MGIALIILGLGGGFSINAKRCSCSCRPTPPDTFEVPRSRATEDGYYSIVPTD